MTSYATKLIEITEANAETIAQQWYNNVKLNPRTPAYHTMPEEEAKRQAMYFFKNFGKLFFTDKPFEEAQTLFSRYAEERYRQRIPLSEVIYTLTLMRRHMWLFSSSQAVFITAVEHHQAAESQSRTILMFDYAIYFISRRYQELICEKIEDNLGVVNVLRMESPLGAKLGPYKNGIMAVLVLGAIGLTYYCHAVLGVNVIFTHLLYIPVVLAGIWWKKRGILVAAGLGVFLLVSHMVFLKGMPFADDVIRVVMFLVIGTVVAFLSEGVSQAEELYRAPNAMSK